MTVVREDPKCKCGHPQSLHDEEYCQECPGPHYDKCRDCDCTYFYDPTWDD